MVRLVLLLAAFMAVESLLASALGFQRLVFITVATLSDLSIAVIESKQELLLHVLLALLRGQLQASCVLRAILGTYFNHHEIHAFIKAVFALILELVDCLSRVLIDSDSWKNAQRSASLLTKIWLEASLFVSNILSLLGI